MRKFKSIIYLKGIIISFYLLLFSSCSENQSFDGVYSGFCEVTYFDAQGIIINEQLESHSIRIYENSQGEYFQGECIFNCAVFNNSCDIPKVYIKNRGKAQLVHSFDVDNEIIIELEIKNDELTYVATYDCINMMVTMNGVLDLQ